MVISYAASNEHKHKTAEIKPFMRIRARRYEGRIVKLSETSLRNRPYMVFYSQGTFWDAGSVHGTSVGCNSLVYP